MLDVFVEQGVDLASNRGTLSARSDGEYRDTRLDP
jgi:hypothetical protein